MSRGGYAQEGFAADPGMRKMEVPAIVSKLKAAGVVGRSRRPRPEIERELAAANEIVRRLRRELKHAVASARMRAQRHNPEFVARMAIGNRAFWANPENRARQAEIRRANCKGHPRHLPPLTDRQRRHYRKLRRCVPREQALAGALLVEG